jgi:hypothetical protein
LKLLELHACVDGVEDEHAAEAKKLLTLVMGISNLLVDLELLPIRYIPQLSKTVQEVLAVAGLILERM